MIFLSEINMKVNNIIDFGRPFGKLHIIIDNDGFIRIIFNDRKNIKNQQEFTLLNNNFYLPPIALQRNKSLYEKYTVEDNVKKLIGDIKYNIETFANQTYM